MTDRVQVCFLSFCPSFGGPATHQAYHLAYLARRVRVLLVDEFPEFTLRRLCERDRARVDVLTLPLWSEPRRTRRELAAYLAKAAPTVVAISNPGLLVRYRSVLHWLQRKVGATVIVTFHSGTVLTWTLKRHLLEVVSAALAVRANDRVYVSEFTRMYWGKRYPWLRRLSGRIVPNGIWPVYNARVSPRTSELRVGYVGRVIQEKDPVLFCRIAQRMQRANPAFSFHVFGSGPLEAGLRERYGALVKWHGERDSPGEIYPELDLLLVTSPVENCPFAVLEAKAFGVPTVTAAVGGLPEIIRDGKDGVLVSRRSEEDLSQAVLRAAANVSELRTGSLAASRHYDMELIGGEMWGRYLAGMSLTNASYLRS